MAFDRAGSVFIEVRLSVKHWLCPGHLTLAIRALGNTAVRLDFDDELASCAAKLLAVALNQSLDDRLHFVF